MNAKEMNPLEQRDFQDRRLRREALEKELEQLLSRQSELSLRVKQEKTNLDYERSDVEALEGGTFKSFFYSAIGKKEEKRMQEEDEVDEAERIYEATQKELQALGEEIRRVERAIKELDRADRDYQTLVEAIPARLDAARPRFSERDALDAEVICKELEEQEARQALYGEIIEEGKKLVKNLNNEIKRYKAVSQEILKLLKSLSMNYLTLTGDLASKSKLLDFIVISEKIKLNYEMKMLTDFTVEKILDLNEKLNSFYDITEKRIYIIEDLINESINSAS
jgi:hypothetical protein